MSHAIVSEVYPLRAQYGDANAGVYPRAFVYNSSGSLVSTVDLVHIAGGLYGANIVFSSEGYYSVVYVTYSDAPRTVVLDSYDREAEQVEARARISDEVWNALVEDHLAAESTGEGLAIVRGLLQHNYILDETAYNSRGLLVGGRIRIFRNKADTDAGTNPIVVFTISGEAEDYPLDSLGKRLKVTRNP